MNIVQRIPVWNSKVFIQDNLFENVVCKILDILYFQLVLYGIYDIVLWKMYRKNTFMQMVKILSHWAMCYRYEYISKYVR